MANDYLTLTDFKAALPDFNWVDSNQQPVTTYDSLITGLITSASRAIDKALNRKPGTFYITQDETRYFDGPNYTAFSPVYGFQRQSLTTGYSGAISLEVGELAAFPTSVSVAEGAQIATGGGANPGNYTTWPATDYYAEPINALLDGFPFTKLTLDIVNGTHRYWYPYKAGIKIVGKFGFSTAVPLDVKQVVTEQVIRWFKLAQVNYQDRGNIGEYPQGSSQYGSERFRNIEYDLEEKIIRVYRKQAI